MSDIPDLVVSIVTPSFNQGRFIEETIHSVLAQNYAPLEHIIVDGGSTDGTLEILRKYDGHVRWISEPDGGQSDALNKGLRLAQGEIIGWLNSDDLYEAGAVARAVSHMVSHPETGMVYGDCQIIDQQSRTKRAIRPGPFDLQKLLLGNYLPQPAAFFRRQVLEQAGPWDVDLHYVMDYDLWLRLGQQTRIDYIPEGLARFREHTGSKTIARPERFWPELFRVYDRFFGEPTTAEPYRDQAMLVYGRVHWRAGISFFENGQHAEGEWHCHRAVEDCALLNRDQEFASQYLVRVSWNWEMRHPRVVHQVLASISRQSQIAKDLAASIWPQHLAQWFYESAQRGDTAGVLYATPRLLMLQPGRLFDRGFWSTAVGSLRKARQSGAKYA